MLEFKVPMIAINLKDFLYYWYVNTLTVSSFTEQVEMLYQKKKNGKFWMRNIRLMRKSKKGYQILMTVTVLGSFADPVLFKVLVWIVTEGTGNKAGGLVQGWSIWNPKMNEVRTLQD